MTVNEGAVDRIIRIGLGLTLLSLLFVGPKTWWGLFGLVPLMTGYLGYCPVYELCGVSSCPTRPRATRGGAA